MEIPPGISFTQNEKIESTKKEEVEVHSVPCKIEYTGPANVKRYLLRDKLESMFLPKYLQIRKLFSGNN